MGKAHGRLTFLKSGAQLLPVLNPFRNALTLSLTLHFTLSDKKIRLFFLQPRLNYCLILDQECPPPFSITLHFTLRDKVLVSLFFLQS